MSGPAVSGGPRRLLPRTGGCLLLLVVFLLGLAAFTLFYRAPTGEADRRGAADDAGDAAPPQDRPTIRARAVSPDGTLVASGGERREGDRYPIELRRVEGARFLDREAPFRVLAAHEGPVTVLRFGAGGRELFSASFDGRVLRWRLDGEAPPEAFVPPRTPGVAAGLLALALSPDGRLLAAAGWSGEIFVWDLVAGGPPSRLAPAPPAGDADEEKVPAGHLEDVRALEFAGGTSPLLFSAGGDGLLIAWDVAARRATRVVGLNGKSPKTKDVRLRLVMDGPDREGAIMTMIASSSRGGLLFSDYRSCVYEVVVGERCAAWWSGGEASAGVQPGACLKPLLDRKVFCAAPDRAVTGPAVAFLRLADDPVRAGGFLGVGSNGVFRIVRRGDTLPWREFPGSARRGDQLVDAVVDGSRRVVFTGSRGGWLLLHEIRGDADSPDIVLADQL
ncbi:MAG: hypothetical protein HY907_18770 [Deltaproteobacteria bacterium]|nr:hypothetical protein [Deltaproteobacteria bacterium]